MHNSTTERRKPNSGLMKRSTYRSPALSPSLLGVQTCPVCSYGDSDVALRGHSRSREGQAGLQLEWVCREYQQILKPHPGRGCESCRCLHRQTQAQGGAWSQSPRADWGSFIFVSRPKNLLIEKREEDRDNVVKCLKNNSVFTENTSFILFSISQNKKKKKDYNNRSH